MVERQREINELKCASVSAAANRALLKQVVMECLQSMAHEPKQGAKRATPDAGGSGIQSRSPAPAAKNAKGTASAKGKEPVVARTKLPQVYDDHNKWCPWGNDDLRADIMAVFRRQRTDGVIAEDQLETHKVLIAQMRALHQYWVVVNEEELEFDLPLIHVGSHPPRQ